jgi:hypothetical protein
MKSLSLILTVLFAGCGLAMAQEPTKGRLYIGSVKDEPAWVWQVSKTSADTNHVAANASRVQQWVESLRAQQLADAQEVVLNAQAARTARDADPRNRMLRPKAGGPQFSTERGIILDYNPTTLSGVISGDDGKRWLFQAADWADAQDDPKRGLWVDFVPEAASSYALFLHSLGPLTVNQRELESGGRRLLPEP